MKHLQFILLTIFLFFMPGINAQPNHFIYIQTENKQPFYVKIDNILFSSTASGYLIIPKLKEGAYKLAVGFPKSEWTEQNMLCTIDNNDVGYLLKNFGSKGWGLFNLQTLDVILPSGQGMVQNVAVVNKTDAFSNMLSNVVNDSTIRQTEIFTAEVKKAPAVAVKEKDPVKDEMMVDSPKAAIITSGVNATMANEVNKSEIAKDQAFAINSAKPAITRTLFNKNADGTEMVFVDEANGKKDTVRVFIPADKNLMAINVALPAQIEKPTEALKSAPGVKAEDKPNDNRFLEIELPNPNKKPEDAKPLENKEIKVEKKNAADTSVEQVVQKKAMINSDCRNFASDGDFLKLRKKMAGEANDDEMILHAKKLFKTKCFTVEQVKNLSVLFLKDSGKYAFFDMAYPFVSDSDNFSTLQNQLTETYYINRFQVMIRH